MKLRPISWALSLLFLLTACAPAASDASPPAEPESQKISSGPVEVFPLEGGRALVMDLLSDGDLAQFSEQTAAGGEQARQFINCRANLRILTEDGAVLPVAWDTFSIPMENLRGEGREAAFYRVAAGDGVLAIPQENPGAAIGSRFYAWTDGGIWKVDAAQGAGIKMTEDFYQGMSYTALAEEADARHPLFWIENPLVSPNGRYVVYRSNRSAPKDYGDCLWALDGESGQEVQLTADSGVYRSPEGFVGPTEVLVSNISDDRRTYSILDAATGAETPVQLPDLPNLSVQATSPAGFAALGYYDDSSRGTAIVRIQGGQVETVRTLEGVYGRVRFSPGGRQAGLSYDLDPQRPDSELLLLDLTAGTERPLRGDGEAQGPPALDDLSWSLSDFAWISDSALLVTYSGPEGQGDETWFWPLGQ